MLLFLNACNNKNKNSHKIKKNYYNLYNNFFLQMKNKQQQKNLSKKQK